MIQQARSRTSARWTAARRFLPNAVQLKLGAFALVAIWLQAAMVPTDIVRGQQPIHAPFASHEVAIDVDSGNIFHQGRRPRMIWSEVVKVPDAKWLRLKFKYLVLAHDPIGNTSSTLKIISHKDGAVQILTHKTARQWQNTSAYFNGDKVTIQLIAYPNGRLNRIAMETITAGDIQRPQESICDDIDDRVLSNDPRAGRTGPGGCTAWLFDDRRNCLLTAGHCTGSISVVEFNVPLSNSDGSLNHPPPEDQYVIDPASMQAVDGGVGNDWGYFGCFDNSNTGLSPFEAQGSSYVLDSPPAPGGGALIRITGYGATSAPVSPTFNQAQKTHTGPYVLFSGSQVEYRTDTTGGNSGSPVIYEPTGSAIGIHTHGGCGSAGAGTNLGTGANNAGLQAALANPLGVCRARLAFDYPNGQPTQIDPAGGTTMRVMVLDDGEQPMPGTGLLHVDLGSGFQAFPMTQITDNVYDAVFPATECGSIVEYYVSAESVLAEPFFDPPDAPTSFYSVLSADVVTVVFEDNFETNMGWVVAGTASDGQWDRGIPVGGGDRGDPPTDADGSGSCLLTDNVDGNSDVDGGETIITSPILDASVPAGKEAVISYFRWYSNHTGNAPESDVFRVDISDNNGASWVNLETIGPSGSEVRGGWIHKTFRIRDFVMPTNQMRIRFNASDIGGGSIVEAGVDGVQIKHVDCEQPVPPLTFAMVIGSVNAGGVPELVDSDDQYLVLDPQFTTARYQLVFDVNATSPTDTPSALTFNLEARTFTLVGTIDQEVELFNYDTGTFELVDTRQSPGTDLAISITPTGDPTRFVEAGTGAMRARMSYQNSLPYWVSRTANLYLPFRTRVDQTNWTISP